MNHVELGASRLSVSRLGLGCMGMSEFYGPADDVASLATLRHAVNRGLTFFDTAGVYGNGHNERLIGRLLRDLKPDQRDRIVVATKWGIRKRGGEYVREVDNSQAELKASVESSLRNLGLERIPLYYLHRADPAVPIEETVGAMAELVREGKVGAIGLSEVSGDLLERANKVHPIAALQTEYSLWTRDVEDKVLSTCRRLGIALVAYSPLGRGFLTGTLTRADDLADSDFRRIAPRFGEEALRENSKRLEPAKAMAAILRCTVGQLALAWLLAQGSDIVPIPGTRRSERLDENCKAIDIVLTDEEIATLSDAMPRGSAIGARYPEAGMKGIST